MSDTPRTNQCEKSHAHYIYPVQYDFMRAHADTLERELAEARRHLQEIVDAYDKHTGTNDRTFLDAIVLAAIYLKGGI